MEASPLWFPSDKGAIHIAANKIVPAAASLITINEVMADGQQLPLGGRVVDEAGMISGRQMEGILRVADQHLARVVFSGDTRQIQSVEASDALRILERESQMKSVALTGVQRQTHAQYRDAIQTLRQVPEQGFEKLERLGAVHEVPFVERGRAVADLYREMTADSSRRVLVVAPTHEEIGRVTRAIRNDLSERGHLGQSVTMDRYVPLQWTEAQKRDLANYREGQVLVVHRAARGMEKHESLTVSRVDCGTVIACNARGEERSFTPAQMRSFSVHERQSIDVAPGDRLVLTANRRDAGFRATNGELATVRDIEGGRIQLEDGRTLPANYHQFDHGYAITAHRSQGKTVDGVILSADARNKNCSTSVLPVGGVKLQSSRATVNSCANRSASPPRVRQRRSWRVSKLICPSWSTVFSKPQPNKSNHLSLATKSA